MSISNHVNTLILGDNIDTLLSVLRYSLWLHQKPKSQRGHLKNIHYHIDLESSDDDKTCFLPVSRASMLILRMMRHSYWDEWIPKLHNQFSEDGVAVWGMLDCRIKDVLINLAYPDWTRAGKVLIVCYDWQEKLVSELFSEIADRKEIQLQTISAHTMYNLATGKATQLPREYKRLSWKQ